MQCDANALGYMYCIECLQLLLHPDLGVGCHLLLLWYNILKVHRLKILQAMTAKEKNM